MNLRQKELEASLKVIGVKQHHWLGFKDGKCNAKNPKGTEIVSKYIIKYKPDTILTFGPDGFTGHKDHKAVHAWVINALHLIKNTTTVYFVAITKKHYKLGLQVLDEQLNIFFNLKQPNFIQEENCDIKLKLLPNLRKIKYQALKVMPSQTEKMLKEFNEDLISNTLSVETFTKSYNLTSKRTNTYFSPKA